MKKSKCYQIQSSINCIFAKTEINMKLKHISILLSFIVLASCKSFQKNKDVDEFNYMQNIENIATEHSSTTKNTIQPGDQLLINVTAKDMAVVAPFNQNFSSANSIRSTESPGGNAVNQGMSNFSGPLYVVDGDGNISYPILGEINTTDKTISELKTELVNKIAYYVINPTVNIRLANFKVTVLGEVNRPGEYTLSDGEGTVLNALGLAGDLTMYGVRDNILVIRSVNGNIEKSRINILGGDFINSPYYNLKQGDVIYVNGNKTREKTSKLDPNTPIYISAAGIIVTILALVFRK